MKIRFEPLGATIEVEPGITLLAAATAAGVDIESICGGRGTCAKCKVIASAGLSPLTELEVKGLTEAELQQGYRLACQAHIEADVDVVVPKESSISHVSILSEGIQRDVPLEPWAKRYTMRVPAATLQDQLPDVQNVARIWQEQTGTEFKPTLYALRQLPSALRERDGEITITAADDQVVRIDAGKGSAQLLGIAFDIGTTTIVGYLIDLETGEQVSVSSLMNPQTRFGDDVVSRIDFSTRDDSGLETLQREVIDALNTIIAATTSAASVPPRDIVAMTVVGNTTMLHLFLGISPAALARSPYVPVTTNALWVNAHQLGINIYPDGHVWALPNIAGWVGADTIGVILATGIHLQDEIALAIDIGTNGEMALGSRHRLITCSTAAGPAFEGAHLSCGMRAADGAIDTVKIDGDVHWHTIGDREPKGICGSGLVDLVAQMLRTGIIDETGMMQSRDDLHSNEHKNLAARIVQQGRKRAFDLVMASEVSGGRPIRVSQRDIRELQLAKGAIRAGIEILISELGITHDDVRQVYLAGAFGNYIKPSSALGIGLIPHFPNAEIVPVGNAAGSGAKMALLSSSARAEAIRIQQNTEYLELSVRPDFQEQFVEAMIFE